MSEVNDWAPLAADNTAAPPDGAPESVTKIKDVNDILREMKAKMRRALSDQEAVTATLSGSQLTINGARTIPAYYSGMTVTAIPNAANVGAITARYNGLAFKAVTKAGAALSAGDLPANIPARLTYHNEAWHLLSPAGTTTHAAALAATADAVRGETRIPIGGLLITLVATNPATLLGYGTWAQEQWGSIVCDGTYTDTSGFGVAFSLGQNYGAFYTNPALYANAVPPHQHAIADHTHDISHGHGQTGHGHRLATHGHNIDHAHRFSDAAAVIVPFGTAGSYRLKITNDNNGTVSILPSGSWPGYVWTHGASPAWSQPSGDLFADSENANIQPINQQSGARSLTTAANTPAGLVPDFGFVKACRVWRRTA